MGHPFLIAYDPGPALMAYRPHKADTTHLTTIKGVHPELWRWVRARALLENRTIGELVNDVIDRYREDVEQTSTGLEMTSPYEFSMRYQVMVRGVNPERWRWLRARSILESYTLSEMISELLYRYRATAQESPLIVSTRYQECVSCGRLFATNSDRALACSNRCRVALHRQRRKGSQQLEL